MFNEKTILVTGGTGSFGQKFVETVLQRYSPRKLIVFSRDELKQHDMQKSGFDHKCLRYFIGDVRDESRLQRAFREVDGDDGQLRELATQMKMEYINWV